MFCCDHITKIVMSFLVLISNIVKRIFAYGSPFVNIKNTFRSIQESDCHFGNKRINQSKMYVIIGSHQHYLNSTVQNSVLFYSILFCTVPSHSVPFYSIPFYSIVFYSLLLLLVQIMVCGVMNSEMKQNFISITCLNINIIMIHMCYFWAQPSMFIV